MSPFSRVAVNARPFARSLRGLGVSLLCFTPCVASYAADPGIAELQRAIEELRAQNRALTQRLESLEGQQGGRPQEKATEKATAAQVDEKPGDSLKVKRETDLEQRVRELELAKTAQEDAVRSIVRDSVSSLGSKINESVALGGTLGVTVDRTRDLTTGVRKSSISLSSADFEFEIQASEWALGHIKLEYQDGSTVLFPTTTGAQAGVDRINLDTAYIVLGNHQKFPPVLNFGRMVLPFGISTGHPVADVLSQASPLTVDTFELRKNTVGLSFAFPTPALGPTPPPVVAPPVRPKVIYPLLDAMGAHMGYDPLPVRVQPLAPVPFAPDASPFNAGIYMYEGVTPGSLSNHYGWTAGYHAKGHCGRPYEELSRSLTCPWTINADVSYNTSIFDSRFLEVGYEAFLTEIGRTSGMSASVKSSFGPFLFVGEWNGATEQARFIDDSGRPVAIKPSAWQASLGYQFGWNPWVKEIGAQGTYLAIGYSQTRDLAGVTQVINGLPTRVGFQPKRRLLLTAGEWIVSGLRFVVEYSRNWDYEIADGGTGRVAPGISATLTYQY